jgi:lipoate-protein ligase A
MGTARRVSEMLHQELRVVDFGRVSALRSQTLWHALAYGVSRGGPPTLSFMRPSRPYVGLGYHRRLEEADIDVCREAGLPVFRRMVGGGVVYLDEHQQFFQICLPLALVPRSREAALRRLLKPAVTAFRAAGVPAELDDSGASPASPEAGGLEIVVGQAKICGHGAAQIEDAVVVVGNLIEQFDHTAAARVLALPDEVRAEVVRLMERFVAATPSDSAAFRSAAIDAYGEALGLEPVPGSLSSYERGRVHELDGRFRSQSWLRGPKRPDPKCSQVKVRAGVFVVCAEHERSRAVATVVGGRIERARVSDPGLNGAGPVLEDRLAGVTMAEVGDVLAGFGAPGRRLAAAFAKARLVV